MQSARLAEHHLIERGAIDTQEASQTKEICKRVRRAIVMKEWTA